MATIREQDFYQELAATPDLPERIFPAVRGKIRRQRVLQKTLYALAAALVLAGALTPAALNRISAGNASMATAAQELQNVRDYLNGSDIDEEMSVYVALDEEND